MVSPLYGQDISAPVPTLPSGFSDLPVAATSTTADSILDRLKFSAALTTRYDSNVLQGSGDGLSPEIDDIIITPSLTAGYATSSRRYRFAASAAASRDFNLRETGLSNSDVGLNLTGGFKSKKVIANAGLSFARQEGINRFTSDILEENVFGANLSGNYRLTPKTSLFARSAFIDSSRSGLRGADTTLFDLETSALWQATSLFNLGVGIDYSERSQGGESLSSIGPTLRGNYDFSSKVKLRSSLDLDFVDADSGSDDTLVSWSVGLGYRANAIWSVDLSLLRDVRASLVSGGGFEQLTTYQITHRHKIRKFQTSFSAGYETRSQVLENGTAVAAPDSDYLFLNAAISTPVFQKKADLSLSLSYLNFDADISAQSWDSFRGGLSLSYSF